MEWVNTASKRVAIILIALTALLTTACGIPEIREGIVEFMTEVYEEGMWYFFKGDTREEITKEYMITELPEGFELKWKNENHLARTICYENEDGENIELYQAATESLQCFIDIEHGKYYKETIGDIEVMVFDEREIKVETISILGLMIL